MRMNLIFFSYVFFFFLFIYTNLNVYFYVYIEFANLKVNLISYRLFTNDVINQFL